MDKTKLKRHDLAYVTAAGKQQIWRSLSAECGGEAALMAEEIFCGAEDVPGIVRRGEGTAAGVALGFVHHRRLDGGRLRLAAYATPEHIDAVVTPYEVMLRNIYSGRAWTWTPRTQCLETAMRVYEAAVELGLQTGVLGSAGLELATGLPYTDEASDLDILVRPAPLELLQEFFGRSRCLAAGINMDFEVDFPNGYGVKLAELFMDTATVLGKSLKDVALLSKKDMLNFLK